MKKSKNTKNQKQELKIPQLKSNKKHETIPQILQDTEKAKEIMFIITAGEIIITPKDTLVIPKTQLNELRDWLTKKGIKTKVEAYNPLCG